MKLSIVLVKFLFLGALFIVSNHNLYLNDISDRGTFYDLFHTWISTLFQHSQKIVGYVIDSEWLPPENATALP